MAVSGNVGATATSVGDFTTLLLDINPVYSLSGYPTMPGLSSSSPSQRCPQRRDVLPSDTSSRMADLPVQTPIRSASIPCHLPLPRWTYHPDAIADTNSDPNTVRDLDPRA